MAYLWFLLPWCGDRSRLFYMGNLMQVKDGDFFLMKLVNDKRLEELRQAVEKCLKRRRLLECRLKGL